jgi:hypothetical protein
MFADVFVDFYYLEKMITQGGIILFDDASDWQVAKAIKIILKHYPKWHRIPLEPYRYDKGRCVKYRLAKLVGKTQLVGLQKER